MRRGVKAHELGRTQAFVFPNAFMSFPRILSALGAYVLVVLISGAQEARQIVDSAARVYAGAINYSAQVDSRTISFVFPPGPEGAESPKQVMGIQYRRLQLKVRRPYDYLLGTQFYREGLQPGMAAADPVPWTFLSRTDNSLPKQGVMMNGRFTIRDVPAEQFTAQVNSRLGSAGAQDMVLGHFQALATPRAAGPALGLINPELIGRESRGKPMYRLVAKTTAGHPVMLWIEQETFFIVRTIVQRPRMARVPGPEGGMGSALAAGGGNFVSVVETFYNNQQINSPTMASGDFVIPAEGAPADRPGAEQVGFIGIDELVKLAEVGPLNDMPAEEAAGTGPEADGMNETPPAATSAPKAGETGQGQALSYEQMSGIVLIDGDGGTATGFMTKIRDVDFVVTNQHVLVGNKKLTLKTLSGEEIPYAGIFGAVGGDIAIIRISKGLGELKLATDVFKDSKIGDNVVVVGNRQGGGVATQTTGKIKGIGPKLIEVDADFQSGNSGSPIVNLGTNEVVGVAAYSETRMVDVEDRGRAAFSAAGANKVEKRWFGYRLDSVAKWEAMDLAKLNAQSDRIDQFRETSEALHAVIKLNFKTARQHPRLTTILDNFESRYRTAGSNSVTAATEIKDLFRVIRTISEDGVRDLTTGDYYDYYRTCQYWENSIPAQLEYRKAIVDVLKKYEANSSLYLSRMRGN